MTDYLCPNCRGGFPREQLKAMTIRRCPWCGQTINGDYEPPERPRTVSKVVKDDDRDKGHWLKDSEQEDSDGLLRRLFG